MDSPGRRGLCGLHQRVPAGAGGGADAGYFFSVVDPPPPLALRRGLSANHQMLAIVPRVTAVGCHRLDDFAGTALGHGGHLTRRARDRPRTRTSSGGCRAHRRSSGARPVRPWPGPTVLPCSPGRPGPGRRRAAGPCPPRDATGPPRTKRAEGSSTASTTPSPARAVTTRPRPEVADGLVVRAADGGAGAEDGGRRGAGHRRDVDVAEDHGGAAVVEVADHVGQVLVQRAAEVDVEHLAAPADGEDRQVGLEGGGQEGPLAGVAVRGRRRPPRGRAPRRRRRGRRRRRR